MENSGIMKLKPGCKNYLWGGRRLIDEYGKEYDGDVLAETWELSCHPDGPSVIANGSFAGKTLQQYIQEQGKEILGTNCRRFQEFPILIKFIDAKDNLSIQVHPDNAYALKNEGQYGKTEIIHSCVFFSVTFLASSILPSASRAILFIYFWIWNSFSTNSAPGTSIPLFILPRHRTGNSFFRYMLLPLSKASHCLVPGLFITALRCCFQHVCRW